MYRKRTRTHPNLPDSLTFERLAAKKRQLAADRRMATGAVTLDVDRMLPGAEGPAYANEMFSIESGLYVHTRPLKKCRGKLLRTALARSRKDVVAYYTLVELPDRKIVGISINTPDRAKARQVHEEILNLVAWTAVNHKLLGSFVAKAKTRHSVPLNFRDFHDVKGAKDACDICCM